MTCVLSLEEDAEDFSLLVTSKTSPSDYDISSESRALIISWHWLTVFAANVQASKEML